MGKKAIITCLAALLMLSTTTVQADTYKIMAIAGAKTINIGGKDLTKGDSFSDKDPIKWASESQVVKVCALDGANKGHTLKISARALKEKKAKTLYRYVNMMGRGSKKETTIYILSSNENEVLPIEPVPGYHYQIWYEDRIANLPAQGEKLTITYTTFDKKDKIVEAWLVKINTITGDMTPCLHFKVDIIK